MATPTFSCRRCGVPLGTRLGAYGCTTPKEGKFEYSKDFSELGRLELDPKTKSIATHSNDGMAGTVFQAAKYVIEKNRPVPVITVAQDWDMEKKEYHCVVEQRRGREKTMVTVRDVWAESKGEFGGPCDPSEPFSGLDDK